MKIKTKFIPTDSSKIKESIDKQWKSKHECVTISKNQQINKAITSKECSDKDKSFTKSFQFKPQALLINIDLQETS